MSFLSNCGTAPSDIAARLNARYAKPGYGSQPTKRQRRITIETDLDDENNSNSSFNCNNKLTYLLPSDYKYVVAKCTCERPHKAYECGHCHHYFHGRLSEICQQHPTETFLMDFRQCPYCLAPISTIKETDLSLEQIRNIEEAALPGDSGDL